MQAGESLSLCPSISTVLLLANPLLARLVNFVNYVDSWSLVYILNRGLLWGPGTYGEGGWVRWHLVENREPLSISRRLTVDREYGVIGGVTVEDATEEWQCVVMLLLRTH